MAVAEGTRPSLQQCNAPFDQRHGSIRRGVQQEPLNGVAAMCARKAPEMLKMSARTLPIFLLLPCRACA